MSADVRWLYIWLLKYKGTVYDQAFWNNPGGHPLFQARIEYFVSKQGRWHRSFADLQYGK